MEPDIDAFWNRLQSLIKHSSYTQKSLSKTLGLNAHSLEVMKAKKNVPGTFLTYKIAKLLNTSVEYLVSGEEPSQSDDRIKSIKTSLINFIEKL